MSIPESLRVLWPAVMLVALLMSLAVFAFSPTAAHAISHAGDSASEVASDNDSETVLNRSPRDEAVLEGSDLAPIIARWVHVLSAAVWVGGHVFLLFIYSRTLQSGDSKPGRYLAAYKGYSRVILPVFLILVLSGLANSAVFSAPGNIQELGDLPFGETYQMILFSKILLAIIAAGVGAYASFKVIPKLKAAAEKAESNDSEAAAGFVSKLRTTSYINLAIGVVVILMATALANVHQLMLVGLTS